MSIKSPLIFVFYLISNISCSIPTYNSFTGIINENLLVNVSASETAIIHYGYPEFTLNEKSLRFRIKSSIKSSQSLLVIINDDDHVSSIYLRNKFKQDKVIAERTLCPSLKNYNHSVNVEISTKSVSIIEVSVFLFPVDDFVLNLENNYKKSNLSLTYYTPLYYLLKLNPDSKDVSINVFSNDETCMIFSISEKCPFYTKSDTIKVTEMYETVTKKGNIMIHIQEQHKNSRIPIYYYVSFILNSNDQVCHNSSYIDITHPETIFREKIFSFSARELKESYILPVFAAIGFYALFYVAASIIFVFQNYYSLKNKKNEDTEQQQIFQSMSISYNTLVEQADMKTLYSSRNRQTLKDVKTRTIINDSTQISDNQDSDDSYDFVSDLKSDPNLYRLNLIVMLSDLSRKPEAILERKYFLYFWNLMIISVFYALPVVQLLFIYQTNLDKSGNQDICYYNFLCTRPWYIFTAFNNVISNMGYVFLGLLFILITLKREQRHNNFKRPKGKNYNLGIPQYHGVFYAMGLSLVMEGIMSASYHICPSKNNFQFDTAYMYILACLISIKIYQIRHPDINATAHSFFMTLALFIFVSVMGVVTGNLIFWIIFTFAYLIMCVALTCEAYYMGRWKCDFRLPLRIYHIIRNDRWRIFTPTYKNRMIFLILLNIVNVGIALYGAISRPQNFPSFFLAIFMTNLLLYFGFYIIMKLIHREHFDILSIFFVIIAIIFWALALYCFMKAPTDWLKTPAGSRNKNEKCLISDFYDIHDIWHFLSSLAMFFSFMCLQNVDDSLFTTERSKIPVF